MLKLFNSCCRILSKSHVEDFDFNIEYKGIVCSLYRVDRIYHRTYLAFERGPEFCFSFGLEKFTSIFYFSDSNQKIKLFKEHEFGNISDIEIILSYCRNFTDHNLTSILNLDDTEFDILLSTIKGKINEL